MNDDNLALRFGWAQRYRAAGCQGHLPSLPDTRKNFPASAEAIRNALGNVQRRVLTLPTPRKRSAACFEAFRPLGNVQRRVLTLSEASETFSGVFWSFPTPRKRSAACFDTFRALGASTEAGEVCSVRAFEVPGQLPSLGRGRRPAKKRFAFTFARPQEEGHRSV